jgi:hypothetical protein
MQIATCWKTLLVVKVCTHDLFDLHSFMMNNQFSAPGNFRVHICPHFVYYMSSGRCNESLFLCDIRDFECVILMNL